VSRDFCGLTASALLEGYRRRTLSAVEVTEAVLRRIEALNPRLNAFNLVSEQAIEEAKASERRWSSGQPKGLLEGVPVSIKDLILTRDWPTLRGSKTIHPKGPWNDDAPATARLREHGAVLIGKTTTPEFGWKGVTDSPLTGITRNPWNPDKTPGGSSGGAAVAVACGMGPLAVGTDGGGSIRIPCSFTGLFGIKPSFGRVPAWPLSPFGTVAHVGPISRDVADAALMLTVMSLPDARDWHALPYEPRDYRAGLDFGVRDLRIAYSSNLGYAEVDTEVADIVKKSISVFADLGARVEEKDPGFENAGPIFQTHWFSGAAALIRTVKDRKRVDPGLLEVAAQGEKITAAELLEAQMKRGALGMHMNLFIATTTSWSRPRLPSPPSTSARNRR
jgi:aspartyl-tRNA(Asn)/glutamyl-tRNA(Gln) amidotransferase subunit A